MATKRVIYPAVALMPETHKRFMGEVRCPSATLRVKALLHVWQNATENERATAIAAASIDRHQEMQSNERGAASA